MENGEIQRGKSDFSDSVADYCRQLIAGCDPSSVERLMGKANLFSRTAESMFNLSSIKGSPEWHKIEFNANMSAFYHCMAAISSIKGWENMRDLYLKYGRRYASQSI